MPNRCGEDSVAGGWLEKPAARRLFSLEQPSYITRFPFDPRHDKSPRSSDDQRRCRRRNWLFEPLVFVPGHARREEKGEGGEPSAWNSITRSASRIEPTTRRRAYPPPSCFRVHAYTPSTKKISRSIEARGSRCNWLHYAKLDRELVLHALPLGALVNVEISVLKDRIWKFRWLFARWDWLQLIVSFGCIHWTRYLLLFVPLEWNCTRLASLKGMGILVKNSAGSIFIDMYLHFVSSY